MVREHVQEVEEDFECPICNVPDKQLRLFPECQHFACLECVGKQLLNVFRFLILLTKITELDDNALPGSSNCCFPTNLQKKKHVLY